MVQLANVGKRMSQADEPVIRLIVTPRAEAPLRVGSAFDVKVTFECPAGAMPASSVLEVEAPDAAGRAIEVIEWRANVVGGIGVRLSAPASAGSHTWTFRLVQALGNGASCHAETKLSHDVVAHVASLAVWSLPDAAIAGVPFKLKVGASSSAGRVLGGQRAEIRDAAACVVASGLLGSSPWEGTHGLLWTEIEVPPADGNAGFDLPYGVVQYSAHLATGGLALAHDVTAISFTLPVSSRPRHRLEVTLIDKATGAGLADAVVRIGAGRATTDAAGQAFFDLPDGQFEVMGWRAGYDIPSPAIEAGAIAAVLIEAAAVPDEEPDARWTA